MGFRFRRHSIRRKIRHFRPKNCHHCCRQRSIRRKILHFRLVRSIRPKNCCRQRSSRWKIRYCVRYYRR
jgi:hypothetical protein